MSRPGDPEPAAASSGSGPEGTERAQDVVDPPTPPRGTPVPGPPAHPGPGAAGVPPGAVPPGALPPGYPPYAYGPHGYPMARGTNGMAIASMVLGILWIYWLGSLLALVFGYVARRQIREHGDAGSGFATAGIVLGWVGIGVLLVAVAGVAVAGIARS